MKIVDSCFTTLVTLVLAVSGVSATVSIARADESRTNLVCIQAEELVDAASNMKEEIKLHFRGVRHYGKLLSVNARIRARAASIGRRINRNENYSGLCRDVEKLNALTCELKLIFDDVLVRHANGQGKPVRGDMNHVAAQITNMIDISIALNAVAQNQFTIVEEHPVYVRSSVSSQPAPKLEFQPNHDVAPGVPVPQDNRNSVHRLPKLEGPKSIQRSVLEWK